MYNRGTIEEFNTWHINVKQVEGLPKMGYINGLPAPQNQETVAYVNAIQNPDNSDDYIWLYGAYPISDKTDLSQTDINNLNWLPDPAGEA